MDESVLIYSRRDVKIHYAPLNYQVQLLFLKLCMVQYCADLLGHEGAEIVLCKKFFLDLILAVLVLKNIAGSQFGISNAPGAF